MNLGRNRQAVADQVESARTDLTRTADAAQLAAGAILLVAVAALVVALVALRRTR